MGPTVNFCSGSLASIREFGHPAQRQAARSALLGLSVGASIPDRKTRLVAKYAEKTQERPTGSRPRR
jgi:hypothetical protein